MLEFGFEHVCVATGSRWRDNGVGRSSFDPIEVADGVRVFTPDDVMDGAEIGGRAVVYDDDCFYMGGVIAEALRVAGADVVFVTGADSVSPSCRGTLDQPRIQARLIELGIDIVTAHGLTAFDGDRAVLACVYSGRERAVACDNLVAVTSRQPDERLYLDLAADPVRLADAGVRTLKRVGDCEAPHTIATAVHAGHLYARALDGDDRVKRDRPVV